MQQTLNGAPPGVSIQREPCVEANFNQSPEERLAGDQYHGAISPEPPGISVVGTTTRLDGDVSPSMRANRSSAAVRPSSETSLRNHADGWID